MKILCVATKSPWPPNDGGRLALWLTLQGLAAAGHTLRLVAPVHSMPDARVLDMLRSVCEPVLVPVPPRSWVRAAAAALRHGTALTLARHRHVQVSAAVASSLREFAPDVVHVEQLQALAHCDAARGAGVAVVLRMQNVESALWEQVGRARWRFAPLRIEAARLRRDETRALATCSHTVALTGRDAIALRGPAHGEHRVTAIAPPFPPVLDAGPPQPGAPALALAGSAGWWPNRDGTRWCLDAVAPLLRKALPDARLHVFGGERVDAPGTIWHVAPDDARTAFPAGAIALVPLHIGSGIRMRILEAWARGLPVIATSTAAAGLAVTSGRELLIADTPHATVDAIATLARDPAACAALVAAGRDHLARHHDAQALTATLVAVYRAAIARR